MTKISLVTVSKGRLHHLERTLPLMMAQGADEVVVVDYDCPDGSGDWAEALFPEAKVVRVTDEQGFSLSRARNIGASHAKGDWLAFVDADVETRMGWVAWMREHLAPGHFYLADQIPGERDPDIFGTVICTRTDFEAIEGHDEAITGWGGEDSDLYRRLKEISGVIESGFPNELVSAIRHGDEERQGWGGMRNKAQKVAADHCYTEAKLEMIRAHPQSRNPPLAERVRLMEHTQRMLKKWYSEEASEPLRLRYVLKRKSPQLMPVPHRMESELAFAITLSNVAVRRPE